MLELMLSFFHILASTDLNNQLKLKYEEKKALKEN